MSGVWQWLGHAAHAIAIHTPASVPLWVVALAVLLVAWVAGSYIGRPVMWVAIAAALFIGWKLIGG